MPEYFCCALTSVIMFRYMCITLLYTDIYHHTRVCMYIPLLYIDIGDLLRRNLPGTWDPPPWQTGKVKLAAHLWIRPTSVWHIIAVKGHQVTQDVCTAGVIWKNPYMSIIGLDLSTSLLNDKCIIYMYFDFIDLTKNLHGMKIIRSIGLGLGTFLLLIQKIDIFDILICIYWYWINKHDKLTDF